MTAADAISATLPADYRAREFRESDREPWVEERNAQIHELQRGTADEWREWEAIQEPKNLLRVSIDAPDGSLAVARSSALGSSPAPMGPCSVVST